MNLLKALLFTLLLSAPVAGAKTLLGIDGEESTSIGVYIKDLATGSVIVEQNSEMALTPASVMKVLTSASVLSIAGPDARFSTPVRLTGEDSDNGWQGNLVITGNADPTLESENFKSRLGFCDSVAVSLKRMGISKIAGGIVVEQSLSQAGPIAQWEIEDVAWAYGAGLYGFNWRDNIVKITPAVGKIEPEVPGLEICVEKAPKTDLIRGIDSNRLIVYTRDPDDRRWTTTTTMPDPSAVFKEQMRQTLGRYGIEIGDDTITSADKQTDVYTHRSVPYGYILESLMIRSDNLFAEGMLRTLAPGGSRKDAIERERELWDSRGIDTRYTIINDGSGLTRANRLSAHFIADILEWMANSDMADTYTSYFPRAGKDGTMRGFLTKSPLKSRIALKTGSVSAVQCYAGYKLNADNKPTHVIVILVNGFFCPRKQVQEACENLLTKTFLK